MQKLLKNPLILALDVDIKSDAEKILDHVGDLIGGIKLGPRLTYRYGATLVAEFSKIAPVFVDNKYFDIPTTMEAAIRASFDAGATLVTVHALAGIEALAKLAQLESELNRMRPFKILAVTILTSWEKSSIPENFHSWSVENHVRSLLQVVHRSGLRGLVCSGHELNFVAQQDFFKVVPGIRFLTNYTDQLTKDSLSGFDDQKRTMTPREAIKSGASAIVVGRAILKASHPRQAILDILEGC